MSEEIYEYIERHIDSEPSELHQLMRESNLRMVHGRMCSGHLQGRFLKMLVRLTGALRILELGTFTGYSTLCLAEGIAGNLKDSLQADNEARIDTIEIFDENEEFLTDVFSRSKYGNLVNLIIGDALDVMPGLPDDSYDLIFIDADKRVYADYYRRAKRLLKPGGCMIADNTLWDGHVVESDRHDRQTDGVRDFNDLVASDPDVEKVILPLRDGLTLIRKL